MTLVWELFVSAFRNHMGSTPLCMCCCCSSACSHAGQILARLPSCASCQLLFNGDFALSVNSYSGKQLCSIKVIVPLMLSCLNRIRYVFFMICLQKFRFLFVLQSFMLVWEVRDETDLLPTLFQHNRKDRFGFLGCLAILLFSLSLLSNNHYHTNMPAV